MLDELNPAIFFAFKPNAHSEVSEHVHVAKGEGSQTNAGGDHPLRFRPALVENTTLLYSFRFLVRIFAGGVAAIILLVLGSLLQGDLARAWAGEIRRTLKRDTVETK
jgi:hypothetical protein